MLAKFKRPGLYINHGVWVFKEGYDYPIKAKIRAVDVEYSLDGFGVYQVFVDRVGCLRPEDVYMTRTAALSVLVKRLKRRSTELKNEAKHSAEKYLMQLQHLEDRIKAIQKHM